MSIRLNQGLLTRAFSALLAILLASAFFVRGEPAQNSRPAADFSGLDKFLELTALLEKDQEPAREQWDALFATPGYAVLIQREFYQVEYFAERFRLAFMPSRADALKEQMKKDTGLRAKILPHYLRVKALRGTIERWRAEQRPAELYVEAAKMAGSFLPKGAVSGLPNVSFVIFAPDSRGYDPVVLDALYCMDQGTALANLVGHEFHHYYRNSLVELGQDQGTLWVINQIHAEGIADLIDKAGWIQKAETDLTPEEKSYVKFFKETPAVLRTMDDLFSQMSGMKTGRGALGNDLRKAVPQSGHPTGLYMATLILEELGKEAVVGVSVDPFAFFRLYQKAAMKRGGETPCFSEKALAFLDRLALCR
jgi:Putative zinc dependent peptidase (DUF5700)